MELEKNIQYKNFENIMIRALDCYIGQDAVKSKGQTYLPMLSGMKQSNDGTELYNLYLENALFFPAVGKTVDAYTGMLFRKKPIIGGGTQEDFEYMTYDGRSIDQVAAECAINLTLNYRCAILVDYPAIDTDGMTKAEVESYDIKPYFIFYEQNKILDWTITHKNGLGELTNIVLYETIDMGNISVQNAVIEEGKGIGRRVLSLEKTNNTDVYYNRLYIQTKKPDGSYDWIMLSERMPIMNGEPLSYIPITPCSIPGTWDLDYPLINDLVIMNLADYRNEALYRDALMFLGRPTICTTGLINDAELGEVQTGSSTVWQFRDGGQSWLLSGNADMVGALRVEAEALKKAMATIGARSLASDSTVQEAAETATIRRAGESGILSLIARAVNRCITTSLKIAMEWAGNNPDEYFYRLSTDYISTKVDIMTVQAMFAQYMQGEIPLSVFYNVLDKAELLPEDMDIEKFIEEVNQEKENKNDSGTIKIGDVPTDEDNETLEDEEI